MGRPGQPSEAGAFPRMLKDGNAVRWQTWSSTQPDYALKTGFLAPSIPGARERPLIELNLAQIPCATKGSNCQPEHQREPTTLIRLQNEPESLNKQLPVLSRRLENSADLLLVPPRKRMREHTNAGVGCENAGNSGQIPTNTGASPKSDGNGPGQASGGDGREVNGGGGNCGNHNRQEGQAGNNNGGGSDEGSDYDSEDMDEDNGTIKVDTQCAWCDDGGFMLECDGGCRRSFHVGIQKVDGEDDQAPKFESSEDHCNVLNLAPDLAEALVTSSVPFLCPCCLAKEQQCFACGEFGEEGTEVKGCIVASCGRFYHPKCMKEAKKKLTHTAKGLKEMCPLHWCAKCKKQKTDELGEIVPCRRCPKAYHRDCIPPSILTLKRAWFADYDRDGALMDGCDVESSLLYCLDHKMDEFGNVSQGPLFSVERLDEWTRHYANKFPHLASSEEILRNIVLAPTDKAFEGDEEITDSPADKAPTKPPQAPLATQHPFSTSLVPKSHPISARSRAQYLLFEAKKGVRKDEMKHKMRQPIPYDRGLRKSIDEVSKNTCCSYYFFRKNEIN